MAILTETQQKILAFVRSEIESKGFPPSRKEIAAHMGYASHNAAQEALEALQAKGMVALTPGIARGIRLLGGSEAP